ncbi:MAG: DUF2141 domain-containing protein [Bacteroidia bacterium]
MKYFILTVLLIFAQVVQAFDLRVNIDNINSLEGQIQIIIYNTKENFLDDEKGFKLLHFDIKATKMSCLIENLSAGVYAVAILHDKNDDGKCAKNWLGIPTEGYGFSNNFRPKLAPPKFEDVSFKIDKDTTLNIKLIY